MDCFIIVTPTTLRSTLTVVHQVCAALSGKRLSRVDAVADWTTINKLRQNTSNLGFV